MTYTIPNLLTLLRIGLIPVFVVVYWLPYGWAPIWAAWIFIIAGVREWMAELGARASVAVSVIGKLKTLLQIVAITMLVYKYDIQGIPTIIVGEWLLYLAAALTLWSMGMYMKAAWPALNSGRES